MMISLKPSCAAHAIFPAPHLGVKMKYFAFYLFQKQNGPQGPVFSNKACGPPGGLFGIDQEVVTLRGLYGNSGWLWGFRLPAFLTDLRQAESILTHR